MIDVIYEDAELLVVVKPAGMESQESKNSRPDMVSEIKKHLKRNGAKSLYVGVVHRLDCPVSGIMVYAKTPFAAAELSRQIAKQGHMDKEYLAIVSGNPKARETIESLMDFDRKTNTSFLSDRGKEARLSYENQGELKESWGLFEKQKSILKDYEQIKGKPLFLLKVRLYTGRHHQIRLQLREAGLPIVGDTKYSPDFADYKGRPALCLCSSGLTFTHPKTKKRVSFTLEED